MSQLSELAGGARFLASFLLAVVALRFAYSTGKEVVENRLYKALDLEDAPKKPEPRPPPSNVEPAPPPPTPAPPSPTASVAVAGAPLRLPTVVNDDGARSDVLINGVNVGKSPYIGEVSCKAGETVVIELIPPRGMPKRVERRCAPGGTLRVGGD